MLRLLMMVATGAMLPPAAAQMSDAQRGRRIDVDLSNFTFAPARIVLRAGEPYVLHLTNSGSGGHNFSAKAFFAAASIDPRDQARVGKGEVEMKRGEQVDVHLVAPSPAHFELHCGHFMHSTFGMKGEIVVS